MVTKVLISGLYDAMDISCFRLILLHSTTHRRISMSTELYNAKPILAAVSAGLLRGLAPVPVRPAKRESA